MYDTARRVALVRQRVRKNTHRRQRREAISLSAACMLLCAALMQAAGTLIAPGQTAAWGSFGAMLLREDAGGYVLVAVAAFAAAVVLTIVCVRLRERESREKADPEKRENHIMKETLSILFPQHGRSAHLRSGGLRDRAV